VPAFDWVKNLLSKKLTPKQVQSLDYQTSSAFAIFWNLCRAWLPAEIIEDITQYMGKTKIPSMDASRSLSSRTGAYTVIADGAKFEFSNVDLAPLTGVMARNYSRCDFNLTLV
jgi:hypothetical protein